jgi:hypothetical protein
MMIDWRNDRFTFDNKFRYLLKNKFSNEEAKEFLMNNYSLSALVFQERIENEFYKNILPSEIISKDLLELKNEIVKNNFLNKN